MPDNGENSVSLEASKAAADRARDEILARHRVGPRFEPALCADCEAKGRDYSKRERAAMDELMANPAWRSYVGPWLSGPEVDRARELARSLPQD